MGGASRRFGSDKALADAGGVALGASVATALRNAGIDPVVAIGGSAGQQLGLVVVPDRQPGLGPLAGIASALTWASTPLMLIAPCDLPLLTADHVATLCDAAAAREVGAGRAVVAVVAGRPEPSLAVWPTESGRDVYRLVTSGQRRLRSMLDLLPWDGVELPAIALSDADDPARLQTLITTAPPAGDTDSFESEHEL